MEIIFVQLSNKACEIAMLEMLGEYGLGESLVLYSNSANRPLKEPEACTYFEDYKAIHLIAPSNDRCI